MKYIMNKEEFKKLFVRSLEIAAHNAEEFLGFKVSRNFKILLYGAGHSGLIITPNKALDVLYLGQDKFFRIVDLSVTEASKNYTTVFLRVSSHEPSNFDSTWNDPKGSGPFKQLIPIEIKITEENPNID